MKVDSMSAGSGEQTTRRMARWTVERPAVALTLRVAAGPDLGLAFALQPGMWLVGRARRADVRLRSGMVSRAHAKLVVSREGLVELIDLAATNPTRVNGTVVHSLSLRVGDRIVIGDVELALCSTEPRPEVTPKLTERELEVARAVMDGLTNVEIGRRLCISPRTVGTHLSNVYERLAISTRAELTRYLLEQGVYA